MSRKYLGFLALLVSITISVSCFALVMIENRGRWPDSWPKELESYRKQAKTVRIAHGTQETLYEIPFDKREDFEKTWPHILKLKSKGAPLILERSPSTYSVSGSTLKIGVRILWPSGRTVGLPDGTQLEAKEPWPDYIKSPLGELPEYVVIEDGKWVPFDREEQQGFRHHRARVDIVLVTDGIIVDLNRIPLPPNTPIIDNRFNN